MSSHSCHGGVLVFPLLAGCLMAAGCFRSPGENGTPSGGSTRPAGRVSDAARRYPLDSLPTGTISVNGQAIRVWVVQDFDAGRPGAVEEGLMHVPPEEIADDQGMLFVFEDERLRGFWMRNTITPLDIAFARMNGTIVKIWQMPPYTLQTFPSIEPAMFALEMKQGSFARLGIREGDTLVIPAEVSGLH